MKLHELKSAVGSRKARTRVGRGIAAGKGKTAGRGTKGQRSRAGSSLPAWFEGGQTPLHVRVPKLRGFKPYGRVEYQVVNIGRIADYARAGRFGGDADAGGPVTVNAEVLRAAGLISGSSGPLKILGGGDVDLKLFVAADAFTASARSKIESAGGFVQSLAPERPRSEPPEAAAASPGPAPVDPDESDLKVGASAAEPAQIELPEVAQTETEAHVDGAQGDAQTGGAGSPGTSRRTRKSAE